MKVRQLKDQIIIEGYVISIQRYSKELCENGKKFYEKIAENVFARAIDKARNIEKREIQFFFNHDSNKVLGHTGENVQLIEDAVGLKITAKIEKSNPNYEEILNNISFNRLTGFSFGFIPLKQNWEDDKHVTVEDMKLLEVSLLNVTPAYNGTVVQTRDKDGEQIHLRYADREEGDEMEELLKELIAEVKSLKEAILEDKTEDETEPKEDKEDKTEDKVEPKEKEENKEDEKPVEDKTDDKEENKEDDKVEEKEDKKQDEEPVEEKEEPKAKEDEEKAKEDEEKKRALIQSQLDFLR